MLRNSFDHDISYSSSIGAGVYVVASNGYINGTPLTVHTSTAFNSTGTSTLVAFVSTNTPWNGLPVSISGLSDNLGNTWNLVSWLSTESNDQPV